MNFDLHSRSRLCISYLYILEASFCHKFSVLALCHLVPMDDCDLFAHDLLRPARMIKA